MTIETDAQNVTNAYLSVISAINTYNANPNATNLFNLAASLKGGAAAVSALLTNNTTLNELQGAFGVNASLASFAKAIADLTTAINNNDVKGQIDATLSGISSLSSAVAGVAQLGAAEFAPLEVVAAAATVASLGATRMQSAYDIVYTGVGPYTPLGTVLNIGAPAEPDYVQADYFNSLSQYATTVIQALSVWSPAGGQEGSALVAQNNGPDPSTTITATDASNPTSPPFRFWQPEAGGIPPFCGEPAELWC